MLFLHKNIRIAFSFISGNKLLAMNDEEQHSPFTHKGPQITPLSSLPLRGARLLTHPRRIRMITEIAIARRTP